VEYKDRYWVYLDEPQVLTRNKPHPGSRPIESFDLQTGRTITKYPSLTAAYGDQYAPVCVVAACDGRRKDYKGMGWRYAPVMSQLPAAPAPAPSPVPVPTPAEDKDAAVAILTTAHRRMELARLNAAVFCDPGGKGYGVRMSDGRILYRPMRQEVVALWYDDNAQVAPAASAQVQTASDAKARRIRRNRPNYCNGHLEAVCLKTGAVRFTFANVAEAVGKGFCESRIYHAINGRSPHHHHLAWRHVPGRHIPPRIEAYDASDHRLRLQFRTDAEIAAKGYLVADVRTAIATGQDYAGLRWQA
jgi:hypothetical protein